MHKTLWAMTTLLMFTNATQSGAADLQVRDRYGNRLGTLEPAPDGNLVIRDRYGNRLGTMEEDKRGGLQIRDRFGNHTGAIENTGKAASALGVRKGTQQRSR